LLTCAPSIQSIIQSPCVITPSRTHVSYHTNYTTFSSPKLTHYLVIHSFPTRRSSDLSGSSWAASTMTSSTTTTRPTSSGARQRGDRKSTRLNSSHLGISYAVFCLKKKRHR